MDRNKAKGMLWGLVVGDAFGSPIQFSGKDSHPWITEMVACPVFGLPLAWLCNQTHRFIGGEHPKDIYVHAINNGN